MDLRFVIDGKEWEDRKDIDIVLKPTFQTEIVDRDTAVYQKFRIDKPSDRPVIMGDKCLLSETVDTVCIKCHTENVEQCKYRDTDIEKEGNKT
jgi:hypothetical protein